MNWIDFEGRSPVNKNIPNWTPWTAQKWNDWQVKSARLVRIMAWFDKKGRSDWRNNVIDKYRSHWGALKPWLEALSGGKCWFSDTRNLYSHYDVEHFRPKKEAKAFDGTVRDGYWWLAFDYQNFRLCGNVGNRKKGGWFPLRAGSICSSYQNQCEESEEPYFIDPLSQYDVNLIGFDDEGKIIPWPKISSWDEMRVDETRKRLKLNEHKLLSEERRKIWQEMNKLVSCYESATARLALNYNPAVRQKAEDASRAIKKMISPNKELSSVARCFIALRNDARLNRLLA